MSSITKWLTAALLAFVLASGHLLDGPSELDAIEAVEADLQDAIQTAQVQSLIAANNPAPGQAATKAAIAPCAPPEMQGFAPLSRTSNRAVTTRW